MIIRKYTYLLFFILRCGFCEELKKETDYLQLKYSDDTNIERPCGAVYDVNCVRQFISTHAHCKKTYGPVPDPFVRSINTYQFPSVNLTTTFLQPVIKGLNGRIDEFYINRETDNLVMAVEFTDLSLVANTTLMRFPRQSREPIVTETPGGALYPSILVTAVIPKISDLQLETAECVVFVNEFPPAFFITPTIFEPPDPQEVLTVATIPFNIPNAVSEFFLNDALFYFATYLQYNICDFGLKIL